MVRIRGGKRRRAWVALHRHRENGLASFLFRLGGKILRGAILTLNEMCLELPVERVSADVPEESLEAVPARQKFSKSHPLDFVLGGCRGG
jgi:hypothetical protein